MGVNLFQDATENTNIERRTSKEGEGKGILTEANEDDEEKGERTEGGDARRKERFARAEEILPKMRNFPAYAAKSLKIFWVVFPLRLRALRLCGFAALRLCGFAALRLCV